MDARSGFMSAGAGRPRVSVHQLPGSLSSQSGQALVELLVVASALAVLWVVMPWLAHLQDMALSATHASRHVAFLASRGESTQPGLSTVESFFSGGAHRWVDRRGESVLEAGRDVRLELQNGPPLSALGQPGGTHANATILRREWSLEDEGLISARVSLTFWGGPRWPPHGPRGKLGLDVYDAPYPSLTRATAILRGGGHAVSDSDTQERVGQSAQAWAGARAVSVSHGRTVQMRTAGVDAGWARAAPDFDWLSRWSGHVPAPLIVD